VHFGAGEETYWQAYKLCSANSEAQISSINGLHLTLFQNKAYKNKTFNAIQIFHVNEDHCVCTTTIGTVQKEVLVYDSWYTEATLAMAGKQFWCNSHSIKELKEVQKQETGTECGLNAVANATSIAFGMDPTKIVYNETCTREHLVHYFSQKDLEPFPLASEV